MRRAVFAEFDDEFRLAGNAARSLAMHLQLQGRITIDRIRLLDMLGLATCVPPYRTARQGDRDLPETLAMARAQQNAFVEIESLGWMGGDVPAADATGQRASSSCREAVDRRATGTRPDEHRAVAR